MYPALFLSLGAEGPAKIPLAMLIVFVSAKLMAELFERINQPGIVGEIIAGILIGPSVLNLHRNPANSSPRSPTSARCSCSSASASKCAPPS